MSSFFRHPSQPPPPPGPPPPPAPPPMAPPHGGAAHPAATAFTVNNKGMLGGLSAGVVGSPLPQDRDGGTKAWWLYYFWQETQSADRQAYPRLAEFFNMAFTFPAGGAASLGANPEALPGLRRQGAWDDIEGQHDNEWLGMLQYLLDRGFQKVKRPPSFWHATDLALHREALGGCFSSRWCKLAWRGDARSLAAIKSTGGFKPAANLSAPPASDKEATQSWQKAESYATNRNMRRKWHPFSKPANRNSWLLRRTQADNCLYTLVSLTEDFKTATTFPKLPDSAPYLLQSETLDRQGQIKRIAAPRNDTEWAKSYSSAFGGVRYQKVICQNQEQLYLHVERQQLYLVEADTEYFNTASAQGADKFNEFAVKEIPFRCIFGCIPYLRVFHETTANGSVIKEDAVFTVLPDTKSETVLPTKEQCRAAGGFFHGKTLWTNVREMFNNAATATNTHFTMAWHSNGARGGGPPKAISRIEAIGGRVIWP